MCIAQLFPVLVIAAFTSAANAGSPEIVGSRVLPNYGHDIYIATYGTRSGSHNGTIDAYARFFNWSDDLSLNPKLFIAIEGGDGGRHLVIDSGVNVPAGSISTRSRCAELDIRNGLQEGDPVHILVTEPQLISEKSIRLDYFVVTISSTHLRYQFEREICHGQDKKVNDFIVDAKPIFSQFGEFDQPVELTK